jgi:hypothetical protein
VKVALTQGQYHALVSFTYNEGAGRLQSSTLLKILNAGNAAGAAAQLAEAPMFGAALTKRQSAPRMIWTALKLIIDAAMSSCEAALLTSAKRGPVNTLTKITAPVPAKRPRQHLRLAAVCGAAAIVE